MLLIKGHAAKISVQSTWRITKRSSPISESVHAYGIFAKFLLKNSPMDSLLTFIVESSYLNVENSYAHCTAMIALKIFEL